MTSPGTVEPTEAEQQEALDLLTYTYRGARFFRWTEEAIRLDEDSHLPAGVSAIAQALADQRARYEAVADELETEAKKRDERFDQTPAHPSLLGDRVKLLVGARHQRIAAKKIRQVGE